MNITLDQFNLFFSRYSRSRVGFTDTAHNRQQFQLAVEFMEANFTEDYINCPLLCIENDQALRAEHLEYWQHATELLNQIIVIADTNSRFDADIATAAKTRINQTYYRFNALELHADVANLGIREKFDQGSLTPTEWLIDLDLQRMLDATGLRGRVAINPFNAIEIGDKLNHAKTNRPRDQVYSVHFLLNNGSGGLSAGIHWLAARITVDPIKHSVSYNITDSMPLSQQQKNNYKDIIRQALLSAAYSADAGWTIAAETVNGQSQSDGYSCGYRALHNVFQDQELIGDNSLANAYRQKPAQSNLLVEAFYLAQLPNSFRKSDLLAPSRSFKQPPPLRRVEPRVEADSALVYKATIESLNPIDQFTEIFSFPAHSVASSNPADYCNFLIQLNQRLDLKKITLKTLTLTPCYVETLQGINAYLAQHGVMRINELRIRIDPAVDKAAFIAALKTMLSHLANSDLATLSFQDDKPLFSDEDWRCLVDSVSNQSVTFLINLPGSSIFSAVQRDLDHAVSNNQRRRAIQQLSQEAQSSVLLTSTDLPRRTRPNRDPRQLVGIDIEMQQQQQVEVSTQALHLANPLDNEDQPSPGYLDGQDFNGFKRWLKNGQISLNSAAALLTDDELFNQWQSWMGNVVLNPSNDELSLSPKNCSPGFVDVYDASAIKRVFFNSRIEKISLQAAEQLLNHRHLFQYGINPNSLPPGFVIVCDPDASGIRKPILHYDRFRSHNTNPLAPTLIAYQSPQPMATELFESIMSRLKLSEENLLRSTWLKLNKTGNYYRAQEMALRRYLPLLLRINPKYLLELFTLCKTDDDDGFDATKLSFFLDNYPRINAIFGKQSGVNANNKTAHGILSRHLSDTTRLDDFLTLAYNLVNKNEQTKQPHLLISLLPEQQQILKAFNTQQLDALLQVYLHYSEEGLRIVLNSWTKVDPNVLTGLHNTLFKSAESFVPLLQNTKAFDDSYKMLYGWQQNPSQYAWWNRLIQQHANAVGYDDLPALVASFQAFCAKIDEYGLKFYADVRFEGVSSLPTALGRILDILARCRPEDREAQWRCISKLSLHSNGAIRAISEQKYPSFVVPEMLATAEHFDATWGYSVSDDWKDIAIDKLLQPTNTIIYNSAAKSKTQCYRFIAQQPMRLSLSFYQSSSKLIDDASTLTDEEKSQLYAILAQSTCGKNHRELHGSDEQNAQYWAQFVATINNLPVPTIASVFKPQIRKQILLQLFSLGSTPPLPMLKRLLDLIASGLISAELRPACETLHEITTSTGDSIYQGMQCYDATSYQQPGRSIFYRHLEVAKALIDDKSNPNSVKALLSVISQFGLADADAELIAELRQTYYSIGANPVLHYALQLLKDIDRRGLTVADLHGFLNEYTNFPSRYNRLAIQDLVELRFGDYFPAGYFTRLRAQATPEQINQLLSKSFDAEEITRVRAILERFQQPGDSVQHSVICKQLIAISQGLAKKDKLVLFDSFTSLLQDATLTVADLTQLLQSISERGTTQEYLYFLSKAAQRTTASRDGLMSKLIAYLDKILPLLGSNASPDKLNSAIDLLLLSDAAQLNQEVVVARADDAAYELLCVQFARFKALSATEASAEAEALQETIESCLRIMPQRAELKQLQALYEHLQGFNTKVLLRAVKTPSTTRIAQLTGGRVAALPTLSLFNSKQDKSQAAVALLDQSLIAPALDELVADHAMRRSYPRVVIDLLSMIERVVACYPADKALISEYLTRYLHQHVGDGSALDNSWTRIQLVSQTLIELNNVDQVRSLCMHYSPQDLWALLSDASFRALSLRDKSLFIKLVTVLANNDKRPRHNDLMRLIQQYNQGLIPQLSLESMYRAAPYPDLAQIETWRAAWAGRDLHSNRVMMVDYLAEMYTVFDRAPCAREAINGFKLETAYQQAAKMGGFDYGNANPKLAALDGATLEVRELSTAEIKAELAASRSNQIRLSDERLIALVAELLYRTKGMPAEFNADGEVRTGRSYEIHTTQYLALHAMLQSGRHVTSEIATGEGKSRIMMLLIACQYARGQTVDFVTSDMQLATRDYLSFKAFFDALGAKTAVIQQQTPSNAYALDGINFSDAANLSLFRNKARSEGHGERVIHPDMKRRALLLDEADRAYFDLADKRFNYSALADPIIRDMPWVYDVLVDFFSEANPDIMNAYYNDVDGCNRRLIAYAHSRVGAEQASRLEAVSQAQLELWQDSAVAALALKFGEDFVIQSPLDIQTGRGPQVVSEARLVIHGREDRYSKFSFGVHQCLHARLNRLKQHPDAEIPAELGQALAGCRSDFFVDDEKQIIYSSNSKSMLDEYAEGMLYAVTGTAGSIREQEEAKELYREVTDEDSVDQQPMRFITLPRHLGMNREDKLLRLAADETAQRELLFKQVLAARQREQPILVVCKNDSESQAMFEFLQAKLPGDNQLSRIDAQYDPRQEATYIAQTAGRPGQITVSTAKIGRGTDIPLHDEADNFGLRVLVNYLPREREYRQIIGRSGRFGALGDSQLILNKAELKRQFNKSTLTDGFYTATEAYIQQQQAIMDRRAQVERLIKFSVDGFRGEITRHYFDDFFTQAKLRPKRQHLTRLWKTFFDETDKKWSEALQQINHQIDKVNPNVAIIQRHLQNYQDVVQANWTLLKDNIRQLGIDDLQPLRDELSPLRMTEATRTIFSGFDVSAIAPLKTAIYEKYDPAHDGKATIYTTWFVKLKASLRGERALFADFNAWREGRGILFPNLRALLKGHMTLTQYLFGDSKNNIPLPNAPVNPPIQTPAASSDSDPEPMEPVKERNAYFDKKHTKSHSTQPDTNQPSTRPQP